VAAQQVGKWGSIAQGGTCLLALRPIRIQEAKNAGGQESRRLRVDYVTDFKYLSDRYSGLAKFVELGKGAGGVGDGVIGKTATHPPNYSPHF
jgi:hypothetical protein